MLQYQHDPQGCRSGLQPSRLKLQITWSPWAISDSIAICHHIWKSAAGNTNVQ